MTMITSKGAIKGNAGTNLFVLYTVSDTGTIADGFATYGIGSIERTDQEQVATTTEFQNESGQVEVSEEQYTVTVTATLMDSSETLLEFLSETVKSGYYGLYRRRNGIDGKTQEWFYGIGKVTAQHKVSSGGNSGINSMPFKYTCLNNENAITLSTTTLASIGAYVTAAVTIAANTLYEIVDTA